MLKKRLVVRLWKRKKLVRSPHGKSRRDKRLSLLTRPDSRLWNKRKLDRSLPGKSKRG